MDSLTRDSISTKHILKRNACRLSLDNHKNCRYNEHCSN